MDGVGEPRAQEGRDPLALEEAPDHGGLRLVAAMDLDELGLVPRLGTRSGRRPGESDDLSASGHATLDYNPTP